MNSLLGFWTRFILVIAFGIAACTAAAAHCDSMDGPVVSAAKLALERRDVTPALKWVKAEDEPRIREAFRRTLEVRSLGREARELADNYFFETLVRVHRAGEGEPYTGLKPAGSAEPGIAAADRALAIGSEEELITSVSADVTTGIRRRFAEVQQKRRRADDSISAGRQYVTAYVRFIHYVESLHTLSGDTDQPTAAHGHESMPDKAGVPDQR